MNDHLYKLANFLFAFCCVGKTFFRRIALYTGMFFKHGIIISAFFLLCGYVSANTEFVPVPFGDNDSLETIREKIAYNGYSFTVSSNWVYSLPASEKKALFGRRLRRNDGEMRTTEADSGPLEELLRANRALPSSFCWTNVGGATYIGPIRDQGSCGSCYAFGACAAAESTYNFAMGLTDENCVDFSESFIIWCLATLPQYSSHFGGCDGADYTYSELSALCSEGITYESDFPYTQSGSCGQHWDDPRVVFDSWHRISCGDVTAIKNAIMNYGAVDAAVYVSSAFQAYSGGIYDDANTSCYGSPCYYTPANHAISLVGWNDADGGYWILRNSWGTSWGENGYMRIRYNAAVVACEAVYIYIQGGPSVSTTTADNITDSSARLRGTVNPNSQNTSCYFEYGETTDYGLHSATQNVGSGSATISVAQTVTGLKERTTYHYRLVGISNGRHIPGSDITFTTTGTPTAPDAQTDAAASITYKSATLSGAVNPHGASTVYWFKYGTTTAYGQNSKPVSAGSGTALQNVTGNITGLTPLTSYHFCIVASNTYGLTTGNDATFTTSYKPETFIDEDFEHNGNLPDEWSQLPVKPSFDWTFRNGSPMGHPSAAYSGNYNACAFHDDWDARSSLLITPDINFGTNQYAKLTFWYYAEEWLGDQDVLRILQRSSPSAEWATIKTFANNVSQWTQQTVYLDNLTANTALAFDGLLNYGYGLCIDDVVIESSIIPPSGTNRAPNDFDGDGKSDIGCFHPYSGYWYIYMSTSGMVTHLLGYYGTDPVTGDFDGDGLCDYGTYYPLYGWWDLQTSTDGLIQKEFGYDNTTPVTGDFDGDGITDYGCYYPPTGYWYIYSSTEGFWTTQFGYTDTQPITGDFDGDGSTDFGCYYPPDGYWYIYKSTSGMYINKFGYAGTIPITGDFDGDGITDFGCYYAPHGYWYIYNSRDGFQLNQFGYEGTLPITGDYDGDGRCDFGCYYPPEGYWYIYKSSEGFWVTRFGYTGTVPLR